MKNSKILAILVLAFVLMVWLAEADGEEPMGTAFTYQGRLMDANGPADGLYDFQFKLWMDPCEIWYPPPVGDTLSIYEVDVIDGYFTVVLDFNSPSAFNGYARWLETTVVQNDGSVPSDFVTLAPRQELTPTPYSLYAKTAGNAIGTTNRIAKFTGPSTLGDSALYEHNYYVGIGTENPRGKFDVDCDGGNIYLDTFSAQVYIGDVEGGGDETLFTVDDNLGKFTFENGKVGIGTTTPISSLEVISPVDTHAIRATTNYIPVYAHRTATAGTWPAVAGDCNSEASSASGVRGRILSTSPGSLGAGVYGYNYGTGGAGVGVRGHHAGSGTGVYGQCDNAEGRGVHGHSNSGTGVYGSSTNANGVYGVSSDSYGVSGYNSSSGNAGNLGGSNYGVYGFSSDSYGVFGYNSSSGNYGNLGGSDHGVYGYNSSSGYYGYLGGSEFGVYGESSSDGIGGIGVCGLNSSSHNYGYLGGSEYGVYGQSLSGKAGFFSGNVFVTNNVSALSFTDRTPYPKDLATAYQAVMSMERLGDGKYDENNREAQLDHSMLSDFVHSEDGNRDLSATVSCHNEVLKDLIRKNGELEKAQIYIEQLQKQNQLLETRLVTLEAIVARLIVSQEGAIK